jgi:hypothetical protein
VSFNLMLEFEGSVSWTDLCDATRDFNTMVEYFPIPGEPPALGLSLPQRHADDSGWSELRQALELLASRARFRTIEMYSGRLVPPHQWPTIRSALLGE